jgi:hypothetical protein
LHLYLHIGLEKTGTTSIQAVLDKNRKPLLADGVFVPTCLGRHNHKLLAAFALDYDSQDIAIKQLGLDCDRDRIDAFRSTVAGQLTTQTAKASAARAIISSEDLSRLMTAEEIQRLAHLLQGLFETITIVVFLRRQDLLAASRYYSLLLGGDPTGRIFPQPDAPSSYYHFHQLLERWSRIFGSENILLARVPEKRGSFDSVQAFMNLLDLPFQAGDQPTQHNRSLDGVNQLILRNFNIFNGRHSNEQRNALLRMLGECNAPALGHFVSKREAENFFAIFNKDNQSLFSRYQVAGGPFSDDFTMYPDENRWEEFRKIASERLATLGLPAAIV